MRPIKAKKPKAKLTRALFSKVKLEDASDPNLYIGRVILARPEMDAPDEKIVIEHIKGSLHYQKFFEINGTHWVSMLSFFLQMIEHRLPTEEEAADFELATQITGMKGIGYGKTQKG